MKWSLIIGCSFALAACASSPQETSSPAPATASPPRAVPTATVEQLVGLPSAIALVRHTDIAAHRLAGNADELWPRLVGIFQDLQLPITSLGTEARIVGTQGEQLRRIGRQPVSRFFECPGTGYGNTAATQPVAVTVVAQLIPAGSGTDLRLALVGTSRPPGGSEGRCRSTGLIERQIREALAGAGEGS